jgi:predicted membrane-bound spermidine synthase
MASKAKRDLPPPRATATSPREPAPARSNWTKDLPLKSLVFWAGAVLMGLEIAGSRVLAPHFGNSIFVWGSLITVFLAALSIGYYLGGRLADQRPSHLLLSSICVAISAWIIGLSFFAEPVCQFLVSQGLGEESGPLIAALILFLPPSTGMGVVSPFAIRLATPSVGSVGQVAGSLYALSTVGSIAGTMLTTFVLIPSVGLSWILRGLGVTLLVSALTTIAAHGRFRSASGIAAAATVLLLSLALPARPKNEGRLGEHIRLEMGTPYHNIAVVDNELQETRELRFDRFTESKISLKTPYESKAEYTNYFHLAILLKPEIQHALFIGAGGGVGPRSFQMHQPEMQIEVVDIDSKVLEIARSHFFLENSPKITLTASSSTRSPSAAAFLFTW